MCVRCYVQVDPSPEPGTSPNPNPPVSVWQPGPCPCTPSHCASAVVLSSLVLPALLLQQLQHQCCSIAPTCPSVFLKCRLIMGTPLAQKTQGLLDLPNLQALVLTVALARVMEMGRGQVVPQEPAMELTTR